jgi:hypothetical protein
MTSARSAGTGDFRSAAHAKKEAMANHIWQIRNRIPLRAIVPFLIADPAKPHPKRVVLKTVSLARL